MSSYLQAFNDRLDGSESDTVSLLPNLPTPHEKQSDILLSPAMRKVVAAGRQVGKTMMASMSAIGGEQYGGRGLLDGAHVHISSTTQDQSDLFWDYITDWLAPLYDTPGFYKNEGRRIIKYRGGRIRVKTGKNPDALRGGNVDKLILDECAYLDSKAWKKVGMPMLVARNGVAEFYSTPKGFNWFFELFNYASEDDNEDWKTWNFSTLSNPHLSEGALRLLIKDMTPDDYTEEIEAQFISDSGGVFDARRITFLDDWPEYDPEHIYAAGIDWGQDNDFSVLSIPDRIANRQVFLGRWRKQRWSIMRDEMLKQLLRYRIRCVVPEKNSMGSSQIESLWDSIEQLVAELAVVSAFKKEQWGQLIEPDNVITLGDDGYEIRFSGGSPIPISNIMNWYIRHLVDTYDILSDECIVYRPDFGVWYCELKPFTMGAVNKHELITFYRTGLEDHGYALLDDDTQKREHVTYETKRTTTGMYSYSAPSGGHDDTVIGGALAYIAMVSFE